MFFERIENLFIGRLAGMFRNEAVVHGFSTRKGGVSDSPYDSLNLGQGTSDLQNRIRENRRLFFEVMNISGSKLACAQQVHGDRVVKVNKPGTYVETDGLVTNVRGIGLVVQVADCVPVYLYDPAQKAVGLVHAGWRGTVQEISSKAVIAMERCFDTHPDDLEVFFGPSIGSCCYKIGTDVIHHFSIEYIRDGRLDLWQCNRDQLVDAGVMSDHIIMSRLCTVCHSEWFFSYRASGGDTGRMMAVFGLKEK